MAQLLRVQNFNVSRDGFGAGENQSFERPFGHADPGDMFAWAGATASWPNRTDPGGSRGLDDYFTRDFANNIGAEIMGRNKFGPLRGPWRDHEWQGWWGDEPPFHTPVFVMTHHERPSFTLSDTTFHFVNGDPATILERAREAAQGKDVSYTAFASTPDRITARLVVRRVKDARYRDALFPMWRYHPFFTNTDLPVEQADITHRHHAIIETVFADLIDGPLAHLPSGRFAANSAWILCAAIAHNLLRAAGILADDQHTRARGSTLRRRIINVPARLACPQRRPILHLPTHWPWSRAWLALWHNTIGYSPPLPATA